MIIQDHSLNQFNYKDAARELSMPYTVFRRLLGIRPRLEITTDDVAFFKVIEEDPFLGEINGHRFTDPGEMCAFMAAYRVHAGFNCVRHDNRTLAELAPKYWTENQYLSGNGVTYWKMNGFMLDLMPLFFLYKPAGQHTLRWLRKAMGLSEGSNATEAMRKFWPYARNITNFIESRFYIDPEELAITWHRHFGFSRLRRVCLQSFMLRHGIWPVPYQRDDQRRPTFFIRARPGIHYNVKIHDVKSAYPTTAINLNLKMWGTIGEQGDFAAYETCMRQQRAMNPHIGNFLKWLCNSTIGDMNYTDGLIKDKPLLCDVWLGFKDVMEKWEEEIGPGNVLYSYCDCIATKLPELPALPGYDVAIKHDLEWLVVYNANRTLGKSRDGKLKRTHFDRPQGTVNLKLFSLADRQIDDILLRDGPEILREPISIDLSSFPEEAFSLLVVKDGPCKDPAYFELWFGLKEGENVFYLGKGGRPVRDPKKLHRPAYEKLLSSYLKLYLLKEEATDGQD